MLELTQVGGYMRVGITRRLPRMKNPIAIAPPSYRRGEKWAQRHWLMLSVTLSLLGALLSYMDRAIVIITIVMVIMITITGGTGVLTVRHQGESLG